MRICAIIYICFISCSIAAPLPPLKIAVPHFYPPFILEGVNHSVTGFDILFMTRICTKIHRSCNFIPMNTVDILPAVANKKVDLGLGALTITLERYQLVNFSIPYLLSQSRFLGKSLPNNYHFQLDEFNHKTIGITSGSSFAKQLALMHNLDEKIVMFSDINELVGALNENNIDLALMDNATALYWQNHSSNTLEALGKPFNYGFGIGIAIHRDNVALTKVIDLAILIEQNTLTFKQLYNMYFSEF